MVGVIIDHRAAIASMSSAAVPCAQVIRKQKLSNIACETSLAADQAGYSPGCRRAEAPFVKRQGAAEEEELNVPVNHCGGSWRGRMDAKDGSSAGAPPKPRRRKPEE